ncbi:hypothetical protein K1719_020051 [Acacia pycnantha]|nr:hypothetical protein K1719_020051 [Acacia pycnantha]
MRKRESERGKERGGGKASGGGGKEGLVAGKGVGDGDIKADPTKGVHGAGGKGFTFGQTAEAGRSGEGSHSGATSNQRSGGAPWPLSYRDKLLSRCAGFLVKHSEEDDIVRGWKEYFHKMNEKETQGVSVEVDEEDCPMSRRIERIVARTGWKYDRKMIKVDRSTSIYDKGGFARILRGDRFEETACANVCGFLVKNVLLFTRLHHVCFACGKYGHKKSECQIKEEQEKAHPQEHGHAEVGVEDAGGGTPEKDPVIGGEVAVQEKENIVGGDGGRTAKPENPLGKDFNVNNQQTVAQNVKEDLRDLRRISRNKGESPGYGENKGELTKLKAPTKVEWVQVGSKRKNMGKGKMNGKENISPANRSAHVNIMGRELEPISSNSFKALQGLADQDKLVARIIEDKSIIGLESAQTVPNNLISDTVMEMNGSIVFQPEMNLGALEDNCRLLNSGPTLNHQLEQVVCDQDRTLGEVEIPQHNPLVDCEGYSGGIWCLWDHSITSISVIERHHQFLHLQGET